VIVVRVSRRMAWGMDGTVRGRRVSRSMRVSRRALKRRAFGRTSIGMISRVVINMMIVGLLRELLHLHVERNENSLPVRSRSTVLAYVDQEGTILALTHLPSVIGVCNRVSACVIAIHVDLVYALLVVVNLAEHNHLMGPDLLPSNGGMHVVQVCGE